MTVYDEVPTGKGTSTRPKSVMSRTSTGTRYSGNPGTAPKQDAKTGYALTFTYLGKKGYSMTLWASTFVGRKKWFENIESRQEILRQRSNIFDTITLSENFFLGTNRVNCSVPFDFGRRIIYGTDDGVYLSDLREKARPPTKVLPLPGVTQVDVLEEYQILIVLAEKSVHTFTLDALDPSDPMGSLKRGRRISSHTSFFRAGICLGRTLVCVVKSSSLSSTIKTLEPIEQNVRGKKQPTFKKLLQGGQDSLRVFKEFYIPTESSSIHFLKTKLCVGCTKGFEIVDLETLDTQGLLDPADNSLDFVHRRENVKPIAIYRISGEFLLCYDEFAFYVNKNGWRAKGNWIIHWEGNPTSFAYHHPYVLAFEPSFVEVRHVETGALHQVITGVNLRCLFADVPPTTRACTSRTHRRWRRCEPTRSTQPWQVLTVDRWPPCRMAWVLPWHLSQAQGLASSRSTPSTVPWSLERPVCPALLESDQELHRCAPEHNRSQEHRVRRWVTPPPRQRDLPPARRKAANAIRIPTTSDTTTSTGAAQPRVGVGRSQPQPDCVYW